MVERRRFFFSLALTLFLLALNLVLFNLLLSGWTSARVDLTEERIYSISPATRRLLASLDDDVRIRGYFSRRTHPKLAPLVPQIRDLLDEYQAISHGRVNVEFVDPGEDREAEREAMDRFGVKSTPFRLASKYEAGIVNAYFALVVQYGDQYVRYGFEDLIEVDPLPDGDIDVRLRNLEYDLTRAIKKVVYGFRDTSELFEQAGTKMRLTAVLSPKTLPDVFRDVPDAVRKAAAELKKKGGGQFEYVEVDPTGDEAKQREVLERYGARPMGMGLFGGRSFYLYAFLEYGNRMKQLSLTGEGVSAAAIREAVEDVLRQVAPGFLQTVGVVTPEPAIPPELLMQLRMQGRMPPQPPPEFQQIRKMLERDYRVRDVKLGTGDGVPPEVSVLLVLKPKNLDAKAVYDLDQYLMRGGRVIVCAGRYDVDFSPSGLRLSPIKTGLEDWLQHLGVTVQPTLVLDDRNQPLPIPEVHMTPLGPLRTWTLRPYPYLVEVRGDGLVNRQITSRLEAMGIYWGSPVEVDRKKVGEAKVFEILRSSKRSWTDDDTSKAGYVDYQVPARGTEPKVLAVALDGTFSSYFAGKEPPKPNGDKPARVPMERSPKTRLVVIGDSEFLSDLVARALGAQEGGFFAENLAFVQNLIDWTNLDSDMIAIRSRGATVRRLDHLPRRTEAAVEAADYAVPLLLLLALGVYRAWRRRNATPLVPVAAGSAGAVRRDG